MWVSFYVLKFLELIPTFVEKLNIMPEELKDNVSEIFHIRILGKIMRVGNIDVLFLYKGAP